MLTGELYDSYVEELVSMRTSAREFATVYNQTKYDKSVREKLLKEFLGGMGKNIDIQTPFFCDYGNHIFIGDNFYANFNCVILDCNLVRIGHNVMFGPGVQIYTAHHPVNATERIKGPELASPVAIGNNVWIGGASIICPGVTVGDNTTIGAGSIVVKNIPANAVAVGNPCRIMRSL